MIYIISLFSLSHKNTVMVFRLSSIISRSGFDFFDFNLCLKLLYFQIHLTLCSFVFHLTLRLLFFYFHLTLSSFIFHLTLSPFIFHLTLRLLFFSFFGSLFSQFSLSFFHKAFQLVSFYPQVSA